jgi:putative DNA methylase
MAAKQVLDFARKVTRDTTLATEHCSPENFKRWSALGARPLDSTNRTGQEALRAALLDFIADFANWDNSTVQEYLDTSRALTQAAHEALGGEPGTQPLVLDPFAGGGSIPIEALRVGADTFASDLNPVPVVLNKVILEYIPKYGQQLGDEVRSWGAWIQRESLGTYYSMRGPRLRRRSTAHPFPLARQEIQSLYSFATLAEPRRKACGLANYREAARRLGGPS